jgi:dipeptidyl aminopeptidase/acylaminoacyl peptidase
MEQLLPGRFVMRMRTLASACGIAAALAAVSSGQTPQPAGSGYLKPPQLIVDILDAPPTPGVVVGPQKRVIALTDRRSMPTIAELSQPMLRLAGTRISPITNGPQRAGAITGITLKTIAGGAETKVAVPSDASIGGVSFSPDGRRLSFTHTTDDRIELWVADTATGRSKAVTGTERLNATIGDPCDWMDDSVTLLCRFVPAGRGPAPAAPAVPAGPNIQETSGKAAPAPTIQDLLKTTHDERLFEHYYTSQLAFVDAATGRQTRIGRPGLFLGAAPSPDEQYLLVARIKRPFSRLVSMRGFPHDVEVWNRNGDVVKMLASLPSTEGVPINGVLKGPRGHDWLPHLPATVVWTEALDEGDLKNQVPHRDRVMTSAAPFTATPAEIAKTEWRSGGLSVTDAGIMLLSESDRATRRVRTWILEPGAQPRKLWDRRQQDAYANPGSPVVRRGGGKGDGLVVQNGDFIYLDGQGASPEGDRPFLDRLNLKTLATERLFRSADRTYESFVTPLDDRMQAILTQYETPAEPPNYFVRDLAAGSKRALTSFQDPAPQLTGIEKQFVTYDRKDGVKLSATLYLPPSYKPGTRLPVVMWAYPREFTDADAASQVTGSPHRFLRVGGTSHLFLLTQGYAVFDGPTMPIVGPGETANDRYVDQLVMSAEAAVNKVVEMGVGDRDRIGVGGHSYGAFMTANLLAHSDVFRAGIARSGAYNRTLTPFGFQSERRTFWEVPEVYARMSPFFHAHKINEPILLIHGEMDNNSGTFPIQSERLYMALKGHGGTVRYVTLPYESHGYAARESVLHTLAEMINWMDTHVKNAGPRAITQSRNR